MDIRKRKTQYHEGAVASSSLEGPSEHIFGWKLPIEKDGRVVVTLDFEQFSNRPKLARMFMAAVSGFRTKKAPATLKSYVRNLPFFWAFLDYMEAKGLPVNEPNEIDTQVVKQYISWLKDHMGWEVGSLYNYYESIRTLLRWLKRQHKEELAQIDFPHNPFPRKNAQVKHREAYSSFITKQIEKALKSDIENIKKRLETPYVKTGKGIDPRGLRGHKSLWKDFDNIVWYFENVLDCKYRTSTWLCANGHSSFVSLAHKYHKGIDNVWNALGVWHGTTLGMLTPFILFFSFLSGANTMPILTMRRDCIKQHVSIRNVEFLVLQKARSGNASYKIKHSPQCISIVERVLEITKDLALEADSYVKDYLWLYRGHDDKIKHIGMDMSNSTERILGALRDFVKEHDIRDENGTLVRLNFSRLRATFATKIFMETKGDIVKLKNLLNHVWINTTLDYVSSAGMKDMHEDAAHALAKHEKKMRGQVVIGDIAVELSISRKEADEILSGVYNTGLGKCRNPFDSPLIGQEKGKSCTQFNFCLQCPSCVFTVSDLPRLFSYYNEVNRLRNIMSSETFREAYGWIIQAIDEIRDRFNEDTVAEAQKKALADPCTPWDMDIAVKIDEFNSVPMEVA